jgi:hypothetical protein
MDSLTQHDPVFALVETTQTHAEISSNQSAVRSK